VVVYFDIVHSGSSLFNATYEKDFRTIQALVTIPFWKEKAELSTAVQASQRAG